MIPSPIVHTTPNNNWDNRERCQFASRFCHKAQSKTRPFFFHEAVACESIWFLEATQRTDVLFFLFLKNIYIFKNRRTNLIIFLFLKLWKTFEIYILWTNNNQITSYTPLLHFFFDYGKTFIEKWYHTISKGFKCEALLSTRFRSLMNLRLQRVNYNSPTGTIGLRKARIEPRLVHKDHLFVSYQSSQIKLYFL